MNKLYGALVALFFLGGCSDESITLTTQAVPPIRVSVESYHSPSTLLQGATLEGNRYVFIFIPHKTYLREVRWFLNGTAINVEKYKPWDYKRPFRTTNVANGSHTITARLKFKRGSRVWQQTSKATFTVDNTALNPDPAPPIDDITAMPVGDLPGWTQIFTDDFTTPSPEGEFLTHYPNWKAYLKGWRDTSRNGTYDPAIVSVRDGILRKRLHTDNGVIKVAAVEPVLPHGNVYQLYGRYSVRFRADAVPGYKVAWLLWPKSEVWPRDGEIDFPEGELNKRISAFMHRQGGTWGGDQDAYTTRATFPQWHVATTEWSKDLCVFYLDGVEIGRSTRRVPNTIMRWVLQTETALDGTIPDPSATAIVEVDWVAVWKRN